MTTKKGHLYSAGADGIIKIWSLEQLAKGCVGNIAAHNGVVGYSERVINSKVTLKNGNLFIL